MTVWVGTSWKMNKTLAQATDWARGLAEALAGRILVDVSNPLDFSGGFPPTLSVVDTDSLAEQIQRALPGARVVKSLNTLTADLMVHPESLPEATSVFVSGDDADAKAVVTDLPEKNPAPAMPGGGMGDF